MQIALNSIYEWSLKSGFKFAPQKTECIIFSKKKINNLPTLKIGNQILSFVTSTKILGMHFDTKLTWKLHILNTINECKRRINILKCLAHNNWGADRQLLLLTYKALVRSKIDYGSIIYRSAGKSDLKNWIQSIIKVSEYAPDVSIPVPSEAY